MNKPDAAFCSAADHLTDRLRDALRRLSPEVQCAVREIRLRQNQPVALSRGNGVWFLRGDGRHADMPDGGCITVTGGELEQVFQKLCAYSVHSYLPQIRAGYITLPGGHRAGLCGQAVVEQGQVVSLRSISSVILRISRCIPGAADRLLQWADPRQHRGVLLAGPPGSGKTTLLRDMARQISTVCPVQTAVIDEKGELSGGASAGMCCDVLYGLPKAEGMYQALRNLAPEVMICDEVGTRAEFDALAEGIHAGVRLAVSVHAGSEEELYRRPVIRAMLASGGFDRIALLGGGAGQIIGVYRVEERRNEAAGVDFTLCELYRSGAGKSAAAG